MKIKVTTHSRPSYSVFVFKEGDYDGFYNVYDSRTNLRVAVYDAESRAFSFTDKDASLSRFDLRELIRLGEELSEL